MFWYMLLDFNMCDSDTGSMSLEPLVPIPMLVPAPLMVPIPVLVPIPTN